LPPAWRTLGPLAALPAPTVERFIADGKITPDLGQVTAEKLARGESVHFTSDTDQWNTPQHIIHAVLAVLGEIDLDPCSDSADHPNVPAVQVFTEEDNGLSRRWPGRVYMNPPYGSDIGDWVRHLVIEYEDGRTTEAIALVPARPDTEWWRAINHYPWCGIYGRLHFGNADTGAPFPSAAFYLGDNLPAFLEMFGILGAVYERCQTKPPSQL